MFFKDEIIFSCIFFFIVEKFGLSVASLVTGYFRKFPKTCVYFIPQINVLSREAKCFGIFFSVKFSYHPFCSYKFCSIS